MKKSKKEQIYIFFIVLLSILLVSSIFLMLSGWLYKDNYNAETGLTLGESGILHLSGTGSACLSYTFDGGYISGEELPQNISVKNDGQKSLYLRAKITIFTGMDEDTKIDLLTNDLWTKMQDGYYYFNGTVEAINTVALLRGFKICEETTLISAQNYILTVTVEGLSTDFDRFLAWGY